MDHGFGSEDGSSCGRKLRSPATQALSGLTRTSQCAQDLARRLLRAVRAETGSGDVLPVGLSSLSPFSGHGRRHRVASSSERPSAAVFRRLRRNGVRGRRWHPRPRAVHFPQSSSLDVVAVLWVLLPAGLHRQAAGSRLPDRTPAHPASAPVSRHFRPRRRDGVKGTFPPGRLHQYGTDILRSCHEPAPGCISEAAALNPAVGPPMLPADCCTAPLYRLPAGRSWQSRASCCPIRGPDRRGNRLSAWPPRRSVRMPASARSGAG